MSRVSVCLVSTKLWVQPPAPHSGAPEFKFKVILGYILRLKANLGYMRPKALGFITKIPPKNHMGFILTGLMDEYFIM